MTKSNMGWGRIYIILQHICIHMPARTSLNFLHPQIQNNEEGMRMVTEMGKTFRDVQLCWLGPVIPVLKLVDPAFIAPLLQAPGSSPWIPNLGLFSVSYPSPSYLWIDQAEQQMGPYPTAALPLQLTC